MTPTDEADGTTVIRGPVVYEAALHGQLQKVRDLDPATERASERCARLRG